MQDLRGLQCCVCLSSWKNVCFERGSWSVILLTSFALTPYLILVTQPLKALKYSISSHTQSHTEAATPTLCKPNEVGCEVFVGVIWKYIVIVSSFYLWGNRATLNASLTQKHLIRWGQIRQHFEYFIALFYVLDVCSAPWLNVRRVIIS